MSYEEQISFPFPAIPFLEIVIKFRAYAGMGVYLAFKTSITDSIEALLTFNSYAMAGVEMYVEGGFYIPSSQSPIQINFVVGLGVSFTSIAKELIIDFFISIFSSF